MAKLLYELWKSFVRVAEKAHGNKLNRARWGGGNGQKVRKAAVAFRDKGKGVAVVIKRRGEEREMEVIP